VRTHRPLTGAWLTNMNEERRETLAPEGAALTLAFGPKKILTVEFTL